MLPSSVGCCCRRFAPPPCELVFLPRLTAWPRRTGSMRTGEVAVNGDIRGLSRACVDERQSKPEVNARSGSGAGEILLTLTSKNLQPAFYPRATSVTKFGRPCAILFSSTPTVCLTHPVRPNPAQGHLATGTRSACCCTINTLVYSWRFFAHAT